MNADNDSKVKVEEHTHFFEKEPLSVVEKIDDKLKTSNLENNGTKDEVFSKENVDLDERTAIPNNPNIEIAIWRNRKIHINKTLIPLRLAQFFWFASGSVSAPLISLLLTHRGLKLTEFSSVFSMISLFQLIVSYICGIIVDKLGNAKFVLLGIMIVVISAVIGLLLSPNVTDKSCLESEVNMTCYNISKYTSDLEDCKYACSINNTDYFILQANDNRSGISTSPNATDVLLSKNFFENTFHSNSTITFCNEICSCFDQSAESCTSTSKVEYKILYCALTLCFFTFWSTSYRFLDFAALNLAKQQNSNFGNERFFGMFGTLVATLLCNFVLNIDKSETRGNYDNVYWFSVVLSVLAIISAFNIREVRLPPGLNLTKKTFKMFTNVDIMSVTIVAFAAGIAYSFNYFYHLWFLDSLKASKRIIGIHLMTSSLYGLPVLITSNWWLKKLGRKKIVIIGLLGYAVNGISYSFLYYPWLSLVIQITKGFSFHLFWVAIVIHCGEIAPKGFGATLNAVVGAAHFGIGRSFSVPVGGYLISTFGARTAFRMLAGFCLVTAILYSMFLYLKHVFSTRSNGKQNIPGSPRIAFLTKEFDWMRSEASLADEVSRQIRKGLSPLQLSETARSTDVSILSLCSIFSAV